MEQSLSKLPKKLKLGAQPDGIKNCNYEVSTKIFILSIESSERKY